MHYIFKNLLRGIDQTNQVCSKRTIKERVYQNCKFHDPQGRDSCAGAWPYQSYSENVLFLFKNFSLLPGIYQTYQVCSIDAQGRLYQNYKFQDPWRRGFCARTLPYQSYSENALCLQKVIFLYSPIH